MSLKGMLVVEVMFELSISVPVYNRPNSLKILLDSVSRGGDALKSIQICISDNDAEGTANESVVGHFSSKLNIKYHKNDCNIGMVKNILNSIDMADGKYIWLMGDDDYIKGENLASLLEFIAANDYKWLVLPYVYMSNDYKYLYESPFSNDLMGKDRVYNEFIEHDLWLTGFIGGNLFLNEKRELEAEKLTVIEESYFPHVAYLSFLLNGINKIHVYDKVMCYNRSENTSSTTWADKYFDVYWGWEKSLNEICSLTNNDSYCKSVFNSKALFDHRSLKWVLSRKADGLYNYSVYKKYYSTSDMSYRFKLILLVPGLVAKVLRFLVKGLPRRLNRKNTHIDVN